MTFEELCNRVLALLRARPSAWTLREIASVVKQPEDRVRAALRRLIRDCLVSQMWRADYDRNCTTKVYVDRRVVGYATCYAKRGN